MQSMMSGNDGRPARIRAGVGRAHFGQPFDRTPEQGEPAELDRGVMVFSLDFELGVSSVDSHELYNSLRHKIDGSRSAIHGLLRLFEEYEISATWATVGQLFRTSAILDIETDAWVEREIPHEHLCAPDVIDDLLACRVCQDIGCHTYRHINASALEYADAIVEDELCECGRLAAARGIELKSFVFPFNRIGRLELLVKHGYTSFRGANNEWYCRIIGGQSFWFDRLRLVLKLMDDILARTPPVGQARRTSCGLLMIPHSMFFKGAASRLVPIGRQVLKARRGIEKAVATRGVFHFWTHPQNLGSSTSEALSGLERIFQIADEYRQRGALDVLSMAALSERLDGVSPEE